MASRRNIIIDVTAHMNKAAKVSVSGCLCGTIGRTNARPWKARKVV